MSPAHGLTSLLQVAIPSIAPSEAFPASTLKQPDRMNGVRLGTVTLVVTLSTIVFRTQHPQKPPAAVWISRTVARRVATRATARLATPRPSA